MFCDKHTETELYLKDGGIEEEAGKMYMVQILYCPHCGEEKYKRLLRNGEDEIMKKS